MSHVDDYESLTWPADYGGEVDDSWTTREGKELHAKDMETSHIQNVIRLLKSRIIEDPAYEMTGFEGGYTHLTLEDHNDRLEAKIAMFEAELKRRVTT